MAGRLTKRGVDALEPGEITWDTEIPGFGARCLPSGATQYILKYRVGRGRAARQRWYTIGRHGAPFTPETARIEARKLLGAVAGREDPQALREADLQAATLATFCDHYLVDAGKGLVTYRRQPKRASTLATDAGRVARHIKPLLGHLKVKDIGRAEIERFMRDVAAGRTKTDVKTGPRGRAIVTGGTGTAARTVGLLGSILSYAVKLGIRSDNPVRGLERFRDQTKERHLDAAELGRLGAAIAAYEAKGGNRKAADATRLIALTGCRRGEVLSLRREEVDLQGSCLRLAATKTGKSVRPLGSPATALLRRLVKDASAKGYLFPDEKGEGAYEGFGKEWERLRILARLPDVTAHTLRHTFASVAANEFEYSASTIGALLGHASAGVTDRYIHRVDAPLLAAADKVSRWIEGAMHPARSHD